MGFYSWRTDFFWGYRSVTIMSYTRTGRIPLEAKPPSYSNKALFKNFLRALYAYISSFMYENLLPH